MPFWGACDALFRGANRRSQDCARGRLTVAPHPPPSYPSRGCPVIKPHPGAQFALKLKPAVGATAKVYVGVTLRCSYGATYPETPLDMAVSESKGLTPQQVAEVLKVAQDAAEEIPGMPVVYTAATAIGDWLLANNVDPGGACWLHLLRLERAMLSVSDCLKHACSSPRPHPLSCFFHRW